MAILTDGVGCGSPGGKWPCYPAVFCIPMLYSVFLRSVLYLYVVFCLPMLCNTTCVLCSQIFTLCGTVGAIVSNHGVWMGSVDVWMGSGDPFTNNVQN